MKCDSIRRIICPYISLILITEGSICYVDLVEKGCESIAEVMFGEVELYGRDSDLSLLGTHVFEWQNLEIKTINKSVEVILNDSLIFETKFKEDFGKIVGIIYTFSGPGSVDYLNLRPTLDAF